MKKVAHEPMASEAPMYIYATEMVSDYYSKLDLRDKAVLSVIGSGDQIINAYFGGAKKVTGYDLNKRAPLFADLKITAIKNLEYEEFLLFFGQSFNNGLLGYDTYKKLQKSLREKTRNLFNKIYESANGISIAKTDFFRQRSADKLASDVNAYLRDEKSYKKTSGLLKKVTPEFIVSDIMDLANFDKGDYDIINLSNIPNYFVGRDAKGDKIKDFLHILKNLTRIVTRGGIIFFYSYSRTIYEDKKGPPASSKETLEKINRLGIFELKSKSFAGFNGGEDRITILKRL